MRIFRLPPILSRRSSLRPAFVLTPLVALALVGGLLLFAPGVQMSAASDSEAGDDAAGAEINSGRRVELVYLVRQDCGSCHGMTLKGGLGKALLPENVRDTPVEALASIILDGVPDTPMPPWRGLLSEAEANWIARQLKKGFPQ